MIMESQRVLVTDGAGVISTGRAVIIRRTLIYFAPNYEQLKYLIIAIFTHMLLLSHVSKRTILAG